MRVDRAAIVAARALSRLVFGRARPARRGPRRVLAKTRLRVKCQTKPARNLTRRAGSRVHRPSQGDENSRIGSPGHVGRTWPRASSAGAHEDRVTPDRAAGPPPGSKVAYCERASTARVFTAIAARARGREERGIARAVARGEPARLTGLPIEASDRGIFGRSTPRARGSPGRGVSRWPPWARPARGFDARRSSPARIARPRAARFPARARPAPPRGAPRDAEAPLGFRPLRRRRGW